MQEGKQMPQILIVDDDPMFRDVLADMFELEDIDAHISPNGTQAMEVMRAAPPDILLLDLMMPDISGFDIIHWVRNESSNPRMKIIVLTGKANFHKTEEGKMVDSILIKPIALQELVARIHKYLIADVF